MNGIVNILKLKVKSRYKNAVRHKSCRKYFEARNWVEEKVRQKLIKERNKKG